MTIKIHSDQFSNSGSLLYSATYSEHAFCEPYRVDAVGLIEAPVLICKALVDCLISFTASLFLFTPPKSAKFNYSSSVLAELLVDSDVVRNHDSPNQMGVLGIPCFQVRAWK